MKLVIAVVHDQDKVELTRRLIDAAFSFTKIGSTGGFLRQGNTTYMIGVAEEQMDQVLSIVENSCGASDHFLNLPPENVPLTVSTMLPQPVQARMGGAVVFVVPVDRFERF